MTDEYQPHDPFAEAYERQGLLTIGEHDGRPAADSDRGHDELVTEFIATQAPDGPARADYESDFADEIMQLSEHLDRIGMMLTDSTRAAEVGENPIDGELFVSEFYAEQAIGEAERRAGRCCPRCP